MFNKKKDGTVTTLLHGGKWEKQDGAKWAFFSDKDSHAEEDDEREKLERKILTDESRGKQQPVVPEERTSAVIPAEKVSITELAKRQGGARYATSSFAPASGKLQPETILSSRYKIIKNYMSMGFREIYHAMDTRLDKYCIVKELSPDFSSPDEKEYQIKRFKEEAKILSGLEHPNLPKIIDYFVESERSFMIIDFLRGFDLQSIMKNNIEMTEEQIVSWGINICDALSYLHKKSPPIIHRDINPNNLFIKEGNWAAVIFNFNLVIRQDKDFIKNVGTPLYAAPEQIAGYPEPRSDLYALGATLYHLLTGVVPAPIHFRMPREINSAISKDTESIIVNALSGNPDDRFKNALEMKEFLYSAYENIVAKSPSHPLVKNVEAIEYGEKDKIYLNLVEELINVQEYETLTPVILSNKKKLDKRFFSILDYEMTVNEEFLESLTSINNIIDKLNLRKNMAPPYDPEKEEKSEKDAVLNGFAYEEKDQVYIDLIREFLNGDPASLAGIILANRKKLDKRFFVIFDHFKIDRQADPKMVEELTYIDKIMDNLRIRKMIEAQQDKPAEPVQPKVPDTKKAEQSPAKPVEVSSFQIAEEDRPYFDLINEILRCGSAEAIPFIILGNKKKINRRFFEIFDLKLKVEGESNPALGEELSYISKVIDNLGIRKAVASAPHVEIKEKAEETRELIAPQDKIYHDLITELRNSDPESLPSMLIGKKKILDKRFFEIFDNKLNVEGKKDKALLDELLYINKAIDNLRIRTSSQGHTSQQLQQDERPSGGLDAKDVPVSVPPDGAPDLMTTIAKCETMLNLSPPKPKTVLIVCKELLGYYPDNTRIYKIASRAYEILGEKEKALKYRKKANL